MPYRNELAQMVLVEYWDCCSPAMCFGAYVSAITSMTEDYCIFAQVQYNRLAVFQAVAATELFLLLKNSPVFGLPLSLRACQISVSKEFTEN
jgi:hypothetical protein